MAVTKVPGNVSRDMRQAPEKHPGGGAVEPATSFAPRRGVFSGAMKFLNSFSNLLMFAPLIGGAIGFVGKKAPTAMRPHFEKAASVAKLPDAKAAGFHEAIGDVFGHSSKAAETVKNASGPVSEFAQKTLGKDLHKRLGENSVGTLISSATFATVGTASLASSTSRKISTLKSMHRELTGKNISTLGLLSGKNLPPILKAARKEAFGGGAFIGVASQLTEIGANLYFLAAKKQPGLAKQMGLSLGLSIVPTFFTSSHTALVAYDAARLPVANISGDTYLGLIGGLAPKNTSAEAVEELAKLCYERKAPRADVLRLVNEAFYSDKRAIGSATARVAAQRSDRAMMPNQQAFAS